MRTVVSRTTGLRRRSPAARAVLGVGVLGVTVLGVAAARAAVPATATPAAAAPAPGTIRIWASPADGPLIAALEAGYRHSHPTARFATTLYGPESTLASVNMDVADVAFMAREIRVPLETMAFEWEHHYAPFEIEIANAGLGALHGPSRPGVNLAFIVNRRNPLACITLREADDVFAADHRRGGANIRSWGGFGLTGAWGSRPIHVYGPPVDDVAALFIRARVLAGSRKWNAVYQVVPGGWRAVRRAVAVDPGGIAYAPPVPRDAGIKALRLAADVDGVCEALDARTAVARSYPLARAIRVVLDRRPGTAIPAAVDAFLRYVLSPEGQRVIGADGAYLPLRTADAREQLRLLE